MTATEDLDEAEIGITQAALLFDDAEDSEGMLDSIAASLLSIARCQLVLARAAVAKAEPVYLPIHYKQASEVAAEIAHGYLPGGTQAPPSPCQWLLPTGVRCGATLAAHQDKTAILHPYVGDAAPAVWTDADVTDPVVDDHDARIDPVAVHRGRAHTYVPGLLGVCSAAVDGSACGFPETDEIHDGFPADRADS